MSLYLHNPASQAHLEDLRDRLSIQLAQVRHGRLNTAGEKQIARLVGTVRAMDQGMLTTEEAHEAFSREEVRGFSFGRWLAEMVDEGVYLEAGHRRAA